MAGGIHQSPLKVSFTNGKEEKEGVPGKLKMVFFLRGRNKCFQVSQAPLIPEVVTLEEVEGDNSKPRRWSQVGGWI